MTKLSDLGPPVPGVLNRDDLIRSDGHFYNWRLLLSPADEGQLSAPSMIVVSGTTGPLRPAQLVTGRNSGPHGCTHASTSASRIPVRQR